MFQRLFSWMLVAGAMAAGEDIRLLGIAHVGIRVSDLEKARAFYGGVLGCDEAFQTKTPEGATAIAFFKVNDSQYIEAIPKLKPEDSIPMSHIAMYTDDLEKLRKAMLDRGLTPTPIRKGATEGNLAFYIRKPPGQSIDLEFVQYIPGSLHSEARGKSLSPRRISTHLEHTGIIVTDLEAAMKFYVDQLGFREQWRRVPETGRVSAVHLRLPGAGRDYIELSNQTGRPNRTRAQSGSSAHFSLEVPDIQAAHKIAVDRGMTDDHMLPLRFALDNRWQFSMFDPDGTRVEVMQTEEKRPN